MNDNDPTPPIAKGGLSFPSLDDSPLWRDDFEPPADTHPFKRPDDTPPLVIIREKYPRIATAIELMWGSREMDTYFSRLIVNERNDRAGFPREIMAAILTLSADHVRRFKFNQQQSITDSWPIDRYQRNTPHK